MHIDRIIYIVLAIGCAILLVMSKDFVTPISYESLGPKAFPQGIFSMLLVTLILLAVQKKSFYGNWNLAGKKAKILYLFAIMFAYAVLFVPLGFILSSILAMSAIAILFGANGEKAILGASSMTLYSFLLFDRIFDVILPLGPLKSLLS